MNIDDFDYQLPQELIAQYPVENRAASRLLVLDRQDGSVAHEHFYDLPHRLNAGDLLVLNNSKVMPARLYGHKKTGGKVELLIERVLEPYLVLAHVKANRMPAVGAEVVLDLASSLRVIGRHDGLVQFEVQGEHNIFTIMQNSGHMPLPPYMTRADDNQDWQRYQTVYAKSDGSVAAPTAGLHFTEQLLAQLAEQGVGLAEVTLHVGAGTFQPVRVDDISQHKMHQEWLEVSPEVCQKIEQTKAQGGRVIAVGTTTVRCLETAALAGGLQPFCGETDIFIYPGDFKFKVVDALITNFHLPRSTLLMLVSAFATIDMIKYAYEQAICERYRFFSYGDAMLLI